MWVLHRGKYNSYPPPKEHFSLLHTHRSFKFAASVVIGILHAWRSHCLNHFKNDQIWSILQQKTKPIVFEFDPLFLILMVTCLAAHTVYICNCNLVPWWRRQRKQIMNSRSFNRDYYSFKIFPRFGLAKRTRLIHHNQLLLTKLGRILCLARKWRQKCSVLAG